MESKELGKIDTVSFGLGGYQGAMLGIHFSFSFKGAGCCDSKDAWDAEKLKWSERCEWTEEDRSDAYDKIMRFVSKLLSDAKVESVSELKNIPVECTFENGTLKDWRILTEVL